MYESTEREGFKMKKNYLKYLAIGVSTVAIGFAGIGGIMAYLTDSEKAENVFTVGHVEIDLTEPTYPGNDTDKTKGLLPDQEIPKDPTVTNIGNNDAVIFLKLTVPVKTVSTVNEAGETVEAAQEIWYLKTNENDETVHENSFDDKWVELSEYEEGLDYTGETRTYVFAYTKVTAPEEKTTPIFDKLQLKRILSEESLDGVTDDIGIDAYAIQSDNILNSDGNAFELGDNMDKDTLSAIYQIYVNQAEVVASQTSGN